MHCSVLVLCSFDVVYVDIICGFNSCLSFMWLLKNDGIVAVDAVCSEILERKSSDYSSW